MSFKITIQSSHHEFSAEPGQTILDAALGAGIVLPYSCRDGACSTCKGKVVSGSYDAGHCPDQILPREHLDAGYTLFCKARTSSDLVIEARDLRLPSALQILQMTSRRKVANKSVDMVKTGCVSVDHGVCGLIIK